MSNDLFKLISFLRTQANALDNAPRRADSYVIEHIRELRKWANELEELLRTTK